MKVNINTTLKGQYTIYDENMNVLAESDNLITDWGMSRFVGDRSVGLSSDQPVTTDISSQAFCNNITQLFLGTGTTTPSATDWKLDNIIPTSEYTVTTHRVTTGTTLSTVPPNDDLAIIFVNVQRFKFNNTLAQPSYIVRELGCNWTAAMTQTNRFGIFSRATIPSTPVITVTPGSTLYVKYKLTIVTDTNQVKGNMVHVPKQGAASFPNNKTNVRRLPLYPLESDGTTFATLNEGNFDAIGENVQPLFEDMQLLNYTYVGSGGERSTQYSQSNLLGTSVGGGTSAYKLWWLQFYRSNRVTTGALSAVNGGANPLERYTTFTSTTTKLSGNSTSIHVVPSSGVTNYSALVQQQLTLSSNTQGRKNAENCTITKINSNTWIRTINFVFAPQELGSNITVFKLYPATLGNVSRSKFYDSFNNFIGYGAIYFDEPSVHDFGIVTVFDAPYTPAPDHYVGIQYQFAFIRG